MSEHKTFRDYLATNNVSGLGITSADSAAIDARDRQCPREALEPVMGYPRLPMGWGASERDWEAVKKVNKRKYLGGATIDQGDSLA